MGIIYAFCFGHLIDFFLCLLGVVLTFTKWKIAITTELEFATNGWFLLLSEDVNHFCAKLFPSCYYYYFLDFNISYQEKKRTILFIKKGLFWERFTQRPFRVT